MQTTICPGSDYVQGDFEKTPGPDLYLIPPRYANAKSEGILRCTIICLVQWAKDNHLLAMESSQRPMTFGYWVLLRKVSVDFLLELYMAAIPPEVQLLFENETWELGHFLCLPSVDREERRAGIYANFAVGGMDEPNAYVGSSKSIGERVYKHCWVAGQEKLPREFSRSFHYRHIRRHGVVSNFRILAAFNRHVEPGYLLLLEGIFMILLRTYRCPGFFTQYSPEETYDLVSHVRSNLDIPAMQWRGMNAGWVRSS